MLRRSLFWKYVTVLVLLVGGALTASAAQEAYFAYQENQAGLVALQHEKATADVTKFVLALLKAPVSR